MCNNAVCRWNNSGHICLKKSKTLKCENGIIVLNGVGKSE